MSKKSQSWVIVLAGGDGTRLRPLVRALHGRDVPKQFATLEEGQSLLQATLERASALAPPERTVVVVAREREALARRQTEAFGRIDVVAQPHNAGTGPGLLLPLARVMARAPHATVTILPSDHYVRHAAPFHETLHRGRAVAEATQEIVLIGATPDAPEREYGWIVPEQQPDAHAAGVAAFEEKPTRERAGHLLAAGALWNTFIMVGHARRFWEAALAHMPEQWQRLDHYRRAVGTIAESAALARAYTGLPAADFSKDVLQKARGLRVTPLTACGWSDWGTPRRVFSSLRETDHRHRLIERIRRGSAPVPGLADLEVAVAS